MKVKFTYEDILVYQYATVSLILIFCLLSFIEIFRKFDKLLFAYKILNNFFTGILIGLLLFPLSVILKHIKNSVAIIVLKILFSIITIIQLGQISYGLTTQFNFGADLFGYSLRDMYTILTGSLSIPFRLFLPLIVLPVIYPELNWLSNFFGNKISFKILLVTVFFFGSLNLIRAGSNRPNNQNKKAMATGKQASGNQINDAELGCKLAQTYNRMQNFKDLNKMMDSLLILFLKSNEYSNFKNP